MPQRSVGKECFYIGDHQHQDAQIHEPILADGDDAAALEISTAVMRRLGLSDEQIAALMEKPK